MNQLLKRFSVFVARHQLSISSQAVLQRCIIGLDGIRRKFIVQYFDSDPGAGEQIIDLKKVDTCSVKKIYGAIRGGGLLRRPLEQYLEKVLLCFTFKTKEPPIEICFYHHRIDPLSRLGTLEQKARDWEAVLTKLSGTGLKQVA